MIVGVKEKFLPTQPTSFTSQMPLQLFWALIHLEEHYFFFVLLLLSFVICVEEAAAIMYREILARKTTLDKIR